MVTLNIPLQELQLFFFIFLRVISIVTVIPTFEGRSVPVMFKAGLALSVSLILYHLLPFDPVNLASGIFSFALNVIGEIFIGITVGLFIRMIFAGIMLAGQLIGYQMGLAIANVMDPTSNLQLPIISQLYNFIAVLLFLALNGHHLIFQILADSFTILPLFQYSIQKALLNHLIHQFGEIFVIAVKVGAPVIAVLLLSSVALGLVARASPQMNVFIVAMPMKIIVGLVFLSFCLPHLMTVLRKLFIHLGDQLIVLINLMR